MDNLPLISVIVPVYRVEKYLNKCVQSITEQTYQNLEIILVDDGSPDNSGAICDEWAVKDSRIRVIHQENGGGGKARNTALDAASGELIAFVDSDDYIAPNMYMHLYEIMEDADIAECGFVEVVVDDACFGEQPATVTRYMPEEAMRAHIYDNVFRQLIWNKLYRREVIGDVRFPVGRKIDDEFFTYRVLGNAGKLVLSDRSCYAYRQQPDSVMHEKYSLQRLEGLEAKLQRLEYLKEHMPKLVYDAEFDLFFSCMYAMQGSLRFLSKDDLETARGIIRGIVEKITPLETNKEASFLKNVLLKMAQVNFEGTCGLLNFLIDIHVLT